MTTTIWERVTTALAGISIPKAANVYVPTAGGALPAQYLTYSLIVSPVEQYADNTVKTRSYLVQISIYSQSGLTALPDVTTPMGAAGFVPGAFTEIPFNQQSGHYGLALEFTYLE